MCGIAGLVLFDGRSPERALIEGIVERLSHRGPDGEGIEVRDRVALGHRRLSIVDVAGGRQPLFNEDGEVGVVFNGEIYNQLELRRRLEARGHRFASRCDTEVLVHGWEEWGAGLVEELRGMFAFAIVDWRQGVVFLARDHFGIKPLVYALDGERLAFASEIQALRWLPGLPGPIRPDALDRYLSLGYVTAPWTLFEGIQKLPPASSLLVHFDGRTESPQRYWQLQFRPENGRTIDDWADELDDVLHESVRAHLMSDVPFGAFLSGGLDSSAVVSYMARELEQPVTTFAIGFEGDPGSELDYAADVAKTLGTEHHAEVLRPTAAEILPDLVRHYGEPFGDNSAVPTYYVSRLARRHVPMVLSGDGGDEAFGGYPKYRTWLKPTDPRIRRSAWKRALRPVARRLAPTRVALDPRPRRPTEEELLQINQHLSADWRRRLLRRELQEGVDFDANPYSAVFRDSESLAPLSQAQLADYAAYLPDDILPKVDIASMMHGLEVRTPFVDRQVVELTARIPPELHVARSRRGTWQTKRVLKHLMARRWEPEFVHRKKRGFSIPIEAWFGEGTSMGRELAERTAVPSARVAEFLEPQTIRTMLEEYERDGAHSRALWSLYFLECWLDHHAAVGSGQGRAA